MTVTINFYANVKTSFGKDLYHLWLNSIMSNIKWQLIFAISIQPSAIRREQLQQFS